MTANKAIDLFNEHRYVQLMASIGGCWWFFEAFEEPTKKMITKIQVMNLDMGVISNIGAFAISALLVWLLATLLKGNYEHRILQQLQIINTQTHSWIQSTSGWSTEVELKARLTKGQLKYAMGKGWISEQFLIWI